MTTAQHVAAQFADFLTTDEYHLPNSFRQAPVDVVITAAHYLARNWGEYGYSLAIEEGSFDWTLFRGHHSDGSDFWFVVDRYCNVADVNRDR